jgi:hypothetical protein
MRKGIKLVGRLMSSRATVGTLFLLVLALPHPGHAAPGGYCADYGPAIATLVGTLSKETVPGPPNYDSIHKGDKPEIYWFIKLVRPLCVHEDKADPNDNPAQQDVAEVQLVLDQKAYDKYRGLLRTKVVASGTLFGALTAQHYTPVLLEVTALARWQPPQPPKAPAPATGSP